MLYFSIKSVCHNYKSSARNTFSSVSDSLRNVPFKHERRRSVLFCPTRIYFLVFVYQWTEYIDPRRGIDHPLRSGTSRPWLFFYFVLNILCSNNAMSKRPSVALRAIELHTENITKIIIHNYTTECCSFCCRWKKKTKKTQIGLTA